MQFEEDVVGGLHLHAEPQRVLGVCFHCRGIRPRRLRGVGKGRVVQLVFPRYAPCVISRRQLSITCGCSLVLFVHGGAGISQAVVKAGVHHAQLMGS